MNGSGRARIAKGIDYALGLSVGIGGIRHDVGQFVCDLGLGGRRRRRTDMGGNWFDLWFGVWLGIGREGPDRISRAREDRLAAENGAPASWIRSQRGWRGLAGESGSPTQESGERSGEEDDRRRGPRAFALYASVRAQRCGHGSRRRPSGVERKLRRRAVRGALAW